MKRLQILNAVVLATGASLGLVLSVVCLIYAFYLSSTPRLQGEFDALLVLSAAFWALAGAGALAFFAHLGNRSWRWLAQPLALLPLAGIALYLANLVRP